MSTSNDFVAYAYTSTTDRELVHDLSVYHTLASIIHSRFDYSNFVLVGLPAYLQRRLRSVLNAAVVLCSGFVAGRYDLITDALATL